MRKRDLAAHLATVANISRFHAEGIIDTIFSVMAAGLLQDDKVEVRGFGSFRMRRRAAHVNKHPRTGEVMMIPEKRSVYFVPGKALRAMMVEVDDEG
jgi:integration host factor subunit beta